MSKINLNSLYFCFFSIYPSSEIAGIILSRHNIVNYLQINNYFYSSKSAGFMVLGHFWPYLSSPLWMMHSSPVSFAEDGTCSTCYYTALMICLSIPGRMESNAVFFWDDNLHSVWQQNSNGRRKKNTLGSLWGLTRRMQVKRNHLFYWISQEL